jgi:ankyrin repeat protein
MVESIPSNGGPSIDPLTARRIRAALGLPEPATPEPADPAVLASLHEAGLDDFQRLLRTTNEDEFIAVARTIDPQSSDSQSLTIGHHAARLGYTRALREYMGAYPNPKNTSDKSYINPLNIPDERGHTPLNHATAANKLNAVNFILPYCDDNYNFHEAIYQCFNPQPTKVDVLKAILSRKSRQPTNCDLFDSALNQAAATPDANSLIEWLVANYSHPGFMTFERGHPINSAIQAGANSNLKKLIDLLIVQRRKDYINPSPIGVAISSHNHEALVILLENNVHKMLSTPFAEDPIYLAVQARNPDAIKSLVNKGGCSVNHGINRLMPLSHAIKSYRSGDSETLKALLLVGADPNIPDQDGYTAMKYISDLPPYHRKEILKTFVESGRKLNTNPLAIIRNKSRRPFIEYLLINDSSHSLDIELLTLLKQLGVDLNQPSLNERGETVAHMAVRLKRLESFKALVQAGVSLNTYANGKTPLDLITPDSSYDGFRDYLRSLIDG